MFLIEVILFLELGSNFVIGETTYMWFRFKQEDWPRNANRYLKKEIKKKKKKNKNKTKKNKKK